MPDIKEKLQQVESNISQACQRSGRDRSQVQVVVVTKSASFDQVCQVIDLGYRHLGENRAGHLKEISEAVNEYLVGKSAQNDPVRWHMIGHLQRNKVRPVLKICQIVHSVDTLRLAEEVNTQAGKAGIRCDVFLQVNCSGEAQKYGVPVGAAIHLAEQMSTMPNLRPVGLMTMAPLTRDKSVVRACFVRAREIFEEIRTREMGGDDFGHISMGMSQDYEIAVEEGATILRIGSAIFS